MHPFKTSIGPLHDAVTWFKSASCIVGLPKQMQVQVDWYELHFFGSPTGPTVKLAQYSMRDFVKCDRIVQKDY